MARQPSWPSAVRENSRKEDRLWRWISGGAVRATTLRSFFVLENSMQILHQSLSRCELECVVRADFNAEFLFKRAGQLNVYEGIPFGSRRHGCARVEFGYLENLGGDGRDFGV